MLVRSYSRHSRVTSEEAVTATPGSSVAQPLAERLLVLGMGVGVQQADRDGLDAVALAGRRRPARGPSRSSGTSTRAVAVDALAHLEAMAPRHERRGLARDEVVHVGTVAAADLEHVAEPRRGHERRARARALGERVDHDRRAVHELLDLGRLDLARGDHVEHALREVARRRRDLRDPHLAGLPVDDDEVGERAADVGRDAQASSRPQPGRLGLVRLERHGIERDAVGGARLLDGHVAVEDVLAHALRLALDADRRSRRRCR